MSGSRVKSPPDVVLKVCMYITALGGESPSLLDNDVEDRDAGRADTVAASSARPAVKERNMATKVRAKFSRLTVRRAVVRGYIHDSHLRACRRARAVVKIVVGAEIRASQNDSYHKGQAHGPRLDDEHAEAENLADHIRVEGHKRQRRTTTNTPAAQTPAEGLFTSCPLR